MGFRIQPGKWWSAEKPCGGRSVAIEQIPDDKMKNKILGSKGLRDFLGFVIFHEGNRLDEIPPSMEIKIDTSNCETCEDADQICIIAAFVMGRLIESEGHSVEVNEQMVEVGGGWQHFRQPDSAGVLIGASL